MGGSEFGRRNGLHTKDDIKTPLEDLSPWNREQSSIQRLSFHFKLLGGVFWGNG
jgi:hypothetical protein